MFDRLSFIVLADDTASSPWVIVGVAFVAALMGMGVVKLIGYLRKHDAEKEARQILEKARNASHLSPQGSRSRSQGNGPSRKDHASKSSSTNRAKNCSNASGISTSSRTCSKAAADQLQKQEKMVENNQRKLAEKTRRHQSPPGRARQLLDVQRQTLHQISGLSPEEAKTRLLERLDQELSHEQGALIMKHEKRSGRDRRRQSQRNPAHLDPALRRLPHRRNHDQHRRHPQRRNEGPHHRPRRTQHPRLRKSDRRRRDHRRHAGRRDRQRLRPGPPRNRPKSRSTS